jgi:NAD(P)H-binding
VDKNRQEDIVRTSELDWVLVRPVVLNDRPATGTVRAQTDLSRIHGGT